MRTVRDPLWSNIHVDPLAMRLVDTPGFQRLRYVRQLGLAHLVYPGATHTRFEHALGAYHLARRTLAHLDERGDLERIAAGERGAVLAAALLHDVGHYPFSHALEEIGAPNHEDVARPIVTEGEMAGILSKELGADAPGLVFALIRGRSQSPLQGLISGSLDLDKIEYLKRDALMCGVPYGEIDVDRLIDSLAVITDPSSGRPVVGVREKGLAALESLLFAKYQMYRNVYWHHAVRSATAMYKRLVFDAVRAGTMTLATLASFTDEGLLHHLQSVSPGPLVTALRDRKLHKRALELPAGELGDEVEWITDDYERVVQVENQLADEAGVPRGSILLDYPVKTQMLGLDLPVLRKSGEVRRLTQGGWEGSINLPKLADELYRSARWLRVFASPGVRIASARLMRAIRAS